MIENFLRRPHGGSEYVADALRVIGLVSVIVAAAFFQATDAGVLAFLLPGLLLPRFVGARPAFDIVFCVLLLVAGWSNVLDLYTSVRWWDIPVHIACTGVIAAMVYLLLAQVGVLAHPAGHPSPDGTRFTLATGIVLTTAFGLAVSALWEMVEWFGHAFISSAIFVEYNDTIGDMAVGALGALAAGVVLSLVPLERAAASAPVTAAGQAAAAGQAPGSQSSIGSPSGSRMRAKRQ
ncbi:hypothetical protein [Subtercola sp. Z020]|uniref:hypothetical protein n=1 Tax=Subtercola sp. Z020 TaxID=2080582 RepID=UPI001E393362|nr:hypothetical protein [Subtercola sp. Z020]